MNVQESKLERELREEVEETRLHGPLPCREGFSSDTPVLCEDQANQKSRAALAAEQQAQLQEQQAFVQGKGRSRSVCFDTR